MLNRIVVAFAVSCCAACVHPATKSGVATDRTLPESQPVAVIQDFARGLAAARALSPSVQLRVEREATIRGEHALIIDYPRPSNNPAARDVWCDADERNWARGRAISFEIKSVHPTRVSVSFLDKNGVAYTSWADLRDTTWQTVRVMFDQIRPNPYFQPPNAKVGAAIDVSDVRGIGFAPQDQLAGRLVIGTIVLR